MLVLGALYLIIGGSTPAFNSDSTAVPADTIRKRPKSVDVSEWYSRRLTIHRYVAYGTLPVFAAQWVAGNQLYQESRDAPTWAKTTHRVGATTLAAAFTVNTVTGAWNWWDSRSVEQGRVLRTLHALTMIGADAAFTAGVVVHEGAAPTRATASNDRALGYGRHGERPSMSYGTSDPGHDHPTRRTVSLPAVERLTATPSSPKPSSSLHIGACCSATGCDRRRTAPRCVACACRRRNVSSNSAACGRASHGAHRLSLRRRRGLAPLTSDIETFWGCGSLGENGGARHSLWEWSPMTRRDCAETDAGIGAAWNSLHRAAMRSFRLWFTVMVLGIALVNFSLR